MNHTPQEIVDFVQIRLDCAVQITHHPDGSVELFMPHGSYPWGRFIIFSADFWKHYKRAARRLCSAG